MKFDIKNLVDELQLRLDGEGGTSLRQALEDERFIDVAKQAELALASSGSNRTDLAILRVLARIAARDTGAIDRTTAMTAAEWLAREDVVASFRKPLYFGALVGRESPADLQAILEALLNLATDPASTVYSLSGALAPEAREPLLERLARHPREEVREHFFALLGKHQRLVPPGTIKVDRVSREALLSILSVGMSDPVPRVRERAIAAAYGIGIIDGLRDQVLARASDESMNVRQYAIVAMGVLADPESRRLLLDLLHHGSQPEVTSAIWALARRPDGIKEVLALAGDPRAWVNEELLGAFAEVAPPLSDEQIAQLARTAPDPQWPRLLQRHIDRTRRGAPEMGPDGRIEVVLRKT